MVIQIQALSVIASSIIITTTQRRLGLYLTALAPLYNTISNTRQVTQRELVGDDAINYKARSHRHCVGLRATFTAFSSLSPADQPIGMGGYLLGDRSDGTPASKAEIQSRYAHISAGHVPDFLKPGPHPHLWEYKCYTPHPTKPALGNGSARCGGAASRAEGGHFSMGNTLEHLIVDVIGVAERGVESDGPFVRANGTGWVRATTKHQYADAQARNNPVTLLACESTGALSSTFYNALVALDKESRLKTTHDSTIYGSARSSPRTFLAHHLAAHSSAVVTADAAAVHSYAIALAFRLTTGLTD